MTSRVGRTRRSATRMAGPYGAPPGAAGETVIRSGVLRVVADLPDAVLDDHRGGHVAVDAGAQVEAVHREVPGGGVPWREAGGHHLAQRGERRLVLLSGCHGHRVGPAAEPV